MTLPDSILFLALALAAQGEPGLHLDLRLDLRTALGTEPQDQIRLAPRGCWDGMVLGNRARTPGPTRRVTGEATVSVWDLLPPDGPRGETFGLYLGTLRERLSRALALPPPVHGALELSEFMGSDPGQPQKLDLQKVKSMQERFNRLPPAGSPVR